MTSEQEAEQIVKKVLESWFGESLENMDEHFRVKRFLFDPLCEAITEAINNARLSERM